MSMDIIARGMAKVAETKAQAALDELAQVIEGSMNAEETEFTDLNGNVVTPEIGIVYHDMTTYVYYRWNGEAYYPVSDPRDTVKYTAQALSSDQQAQARTNIGAQSELESGVNIKTINGASILGEGNLVLEFCRTGFRTLSKDSWVESQQVLSIEGVTANDYSHIVGATANDSSAMVDNGLSYTLGEGSITFTVTSVPTADIELHIALIKGSAL